MEALAADDRARIDACASAALQLLQENFTPHGILAARRTPAAVERRYTRIFGRDAAIRVLAMCGSGVEALERGAVASLDTLATMQAANGQIPKYVDPDGCDADFWYLGCIDATLWWLLACDHVLQHGDVGATRWQPQAALAIQWLLAQEHQAFRLVQQNEARDWADIMPRSGYVLYSNALWLEVKRRFGLAQSDVTLHHFNHLLHPTQLHPTQRDLPTYHRARLLQHDARRGQSGVELYLSFVNLAFAGHEGDVFGNLLAILCGAASRVDGAPHRQDFEQREGGRSVPGARYASAIVSPARSVASLYGPAPPEPHSPIPQRRPLAVRRGLLGAGTGPPWAQRPLLARARGAGACQRARRLALYRVVPRRDLKPDGYGRAELERGYLPARPAHAARWRRHVVTRPGYRP